jgi:hypothetical protein
MFRRVKLVLYIYLKYFNVLIFNFAPLHVLRLGRVPHLPHPCYGSAHTYKCCTVYMTLLFQLHYEII